MPTVLMSFDRFPPFAGSGAERPLQFAKYLSNFGYTPLVVAAHPPASAPRDASRLEELEGRARVIRGRLVLGSLADRLGLSARSSRNAASQAGDLPARSPGAGSSAALHVAHRTLQWPFYFFIDWSLPALVHGWSAARAEAIDLVWTSAPPFRNAVTAHWLSLLLNRPLVVDLRDPWTYGSLWEPLNPLFGRIERKAAEAVFDHAAAIILCSPLTMLKMQERFPRAAHKMHTITNGFDSTPVLPLRQTHDRKCLFRYVGVLNERRQPDVLLRALSLAIQADPRLADELHLELIGDIGAHAGKPSLYGVEKQVSSLGRVEWSRSLSYMRGSDVNVLLQTIDEGADVISGKAFEYLAAAKPILAVVSPSGGDAWLINQTRSGKCVPWTDPEAVARAIREYHEMWLKKSLGKGEAADISRFSRRALTGELAAIFDSALGRSPA